MFWMFIAREPLASICILPSHPRTTHRGIMISHRTMGIVNIRDAECV